MKALKLSFFVVFGIPLIIIIMLVTVVNPDASINMIEDQQRKTDYIGIAVVSGGVQLTALLIYSVITQSTVLL